MQQKQQKINQMPPQSVFVNKNNQNHNEHVPVDIVAPDQNIKVQPQQNKGNALNQMADRFGGLPPFQFHHLNDEDLNEFKDQY